ncbi:MAG: SIS domain-containing protein [Nitrospira sp.]|nr:SIS domain-containing protein [Nitrospira sp.]
MMPATTTLSLKTCAEQFAALLDRCEATGKKNEALGLEPGMTAVMERLAQARQSKSSVYVIGNGGSAAVASHTVNDFLNVAKLRAFTLHDSSLLTCMANDYGYENAFARILAQVGKPHDVLIAISSSGNSKNIRNAAAQATASGMFVITLTGFAGDNPLRSLGDVNLWLDARNYGQVEIGHQFLLHNMADRFGANDGELAKS